MTIYDEHHRALQERFESRDLADALEFAIVTPELADDTIEFVQSREFFFLTTVRADGQPTVSHKGGAPGFVRVLDPSTLAFPSYDGNGMFLSMGNIVATAKVGMLFIDFERPHRVRIHADATVHADDPLLEEYPGAQLVVRAAITESFVNCPRYIVKHTRVEPSRYVPDESGTAPVASWKRLEALTPFLCDADQHRVAAEGPPLTPEEYADLVQRGET